MFYDFTGIRIVITGITGGITKATTQLLSSLGAEVIVTARRHEKLRNREIAKDSHPGYSIAGYMPVIAVI